MKIRHLVLLPIAVLAALLAALALYLAYGDLARHKPRIETIVAQSLGRSFAIGGHFELRVLPEIALVAERVRLGNVAGGSAPHMVEAGRLAARVALWSLVFRPVEVRSLELHDVSVVLERDAEGRGNWVFGRPGRAAGPRGDAAVPAIVEDADLRNLRVVYRGAGVPERVLQVETLRIARSPGGALRLAGAGRLDAQALALQAELGPVASLLDARDLPVSVKASLGELALEVSGRIGQIDPLEGVELDLKAVAPDAAQLASSLGASGLPAGRLELSGHFALGRERVALTGVQGRYGDSEFAGQVSRARTGARRLDAELRASRVDLTPFLPAGTRKEAPKQERRYVFDETPLPLADLRAADATVRFAIGELKLGGGGLREVEGTATATDGRLALEARAQGSAGGTLQGTVQLTPHDADADLALKLSTKDLRIGISAGEGVSPSEVPPADLEADLQAKGGSVRQLAESAHGRVQARLGAGKVGGKTVERLGGDLLGQLASRLNPFSSRDPHMQLECAIVRAKVEGGIAEVQPVVVQSAKVAITASGKVDLRTEGLDFDFATRPRSGVGISAGMFTNPFVKLEGTLADPSIGVGAKGVASGAAAALTGGASLIAQGLLDRLQGTQDLCKEPAEAAQEKPKESAGAN